MNTSTGEFTFYAYRPRPDGTEPLGTEGKALTRHKTARGAIRHALRTLGPTVRVYHIVNWYGDKLTQVYPNERGQE